MSMRISMKNICVVFSKQCKDTLKNMSVLIQFLIFPIMTVIMNEAIHIEGMPKNFFVFMFATMYIGMAPLVSMATVISEEKEQNTLRVLLMSNVKSVEYIAGIGGAIFVASFLGSIVFCICGRLKGKEAVCFMLLMVIGIVTSMLIGAAIGAFSKNQMAATSVTVPVMMIFAFLPMLSMFNETIEKVAGITYSQQISLMMNELGQLAISTENIVVIMLNMLVALMLFLFAYQKKIAV